MSDQQVSIGQLITLVHAAHLHTDDVEDELAQALDALRGLHDLVHQAYRHLLAVDPSGFVNRHHHECVRGRLALMLGSAATDLTPCNPESV